MFVLWYIIHHILFPLAHFNYLVLGNVFFFAGIPWMFVLIAEAFQVMTDVVWIVKVVWAMNFDEWYQQARKNCLDFTF